MGVFLVLEGKKKLFNRQKRLIKTELKTGNVSLRQLALRPDINCSASTVFHAVHESGILKYMKKLKTLKLIPDRKVVRLE